MNDFLQAPAVEALPAAPALERFLFEQPWPLIALLALVAIIALLAFRARGQIRRGLAVAAVPLVLAGGVYLLASRVVTDREAILLQTRELIDSTARADTAALARILSDSATLRSEGAIRRVLPPVRDTGEILKQVDRYLAGQFVISHVSLPDRQAALDGPNTGRSQVRVAVESDTFSRTHYSWWRLHWERDTDGTWRCFEIEPLWIQLVGSAASN